MQGLRRQPQHRVPSEALGWLGCTWHHSAWEAPEHPWGLARNYPTHLAEITGSGLLAQNHRAHENHGKWTPDTEPSCPHSWKSRGADSESPSTIWESHHPQERFPSGLERSFKGLGHMLGIQEPWLDPRQHMVTTQPPPPSSAQTAGSNSQSTAGDDSKFKKIK